MRPASTASFLMAAAVSAALLVSCSPAGRTALQGQGSPRKSADASAPVAARKLAPQPGSVERLIPVYDVPGDLPGHLVQRGDAWLATVARGGAVTDAFWLVQGGSVQGELYLDGMKRPRYSYGTWSRQGLGQTLPRVLRAMRELDSSAAASWKVVYSYRLSTSYLVAGQGDSARAIAIAGSGPVFDSPPASSAPTTTSLEEIVSSTATPAVGYSPSF